MGDDFDAAHFHLDGICFHQVPEKELPKEVKVWKQSRNAALA